MHQRFGLVLLLVGLLMCAAGCDRGPATKSARAPAANSVVATNFPLYCFLKSLCDSTDISVTYVGPDHDFTEELSHWSPQPESVLALQSAELVFRNGRGAEFAQWINRVSLDETKLKSVTDAMELDQFVVVNDYATVHRHGPEGEHTHPSVVTRCWLSPQIAEYQVVWCRDQLAKKYPQHKDVLVSNSLKLESKLQQLSLRIETLGQQLKSRDICCSNPEARYLFRQMGLECKSLNWRMAPEEAEAAEKELVAKLGSDVEIGKVAFVWTLDSDDAVVSAIGKRCASVCELDLVDRGSADASGDESYVSRMGVNLERLATIAASGNWQRISQ